ncbi:MAG: hypothetical protein AB1540_16100 [Bdellovibrionota bacterium]
MLLITAWGIALGFVIVISASIFGYGLLISGKKGLDLLKMCLGLGIALNLFLLTGIGGGYNRIIQGTLVLAGLAALWGMRQQRWWRKLPRFTGRDRLWLILPAVYFLTRFFSAGLPQQHSDPLYYHLSAPKLWADLGQIRLTPEHPSYAQSTLWETVYGYPHLWLGTLGPDVHVIVQIFAQWMHMFWGQLFSVLLGAAVLTRFLPQARTRPGLCIFVAWLCATLPSWEWLGTLAKNDYVLLSFVLAGVLALLEKRVFLGGLFLGLAYQTKVIAAWPLIAGVFLFVDFGRVPRTLQRSLRFVPLYLAGAFIGLLPILIRNLVFTGNPFFPMFDEKIGPHWISSWWVGHNQSFGGAVAWDPQMFSWFWFKTLEKFLAKFLFVTAVIGVVLHSFREKRLFRPGYLIFIAVQLLLAFLMLRPAADGRYAHFAVVICLLYGLSALLSEVFRRDALMRWGWPGMVSLGLFINSPVDILFKVPRDYWFKAATKYVEQFHPVYDVQVWISKNIPRDQKILFTCEKQMYYLDREFETVVEMKKWESLLTPISNPRELFALAGSLGYKYLHICPQTGGYPIALRPYWNELLAMKDKALYRSPTSMLWKVDAIVKSSR